MSDETLSLRQPLPKAAGINKKVLAALLAVVGLALGASFYFGFGAGRHKARDVALATDEAKPITTKPEGLAALQNENYAEITTPPKPPEPQVLVLPTPNPPPDARPDLVLKPAVQPLQAPAAPQKSDREKRAEEAAKSGLFFSRKGGRSVAATQATGVAQAAPVPGQAGQELTPLPQDAIQNMQGRKEAFRNIAGTSPYLMQPYLEPQSPYEIKAGAVIPAALKTAVNSDLPGDVTAQVTENVFDSATGRYLLIPQGTTLYGRYDSVVAYGQSRLLIVWQRLIMPDGRSIKVDNMAGTDALGRAGVEDEVNHHWGRLLAGIFLSTTVSVGSEVATRNDSSILNNRSVGQSAADAAAQEAVRVGSKITEKNLNIQPTIEIRPGALIKALVNKDMILAVY